MVVLTPLDRTWPCTASRAFSATLRRARALSGRSAARFEERGHQHAVPRLSHRVVEPHCGRLVTDCGSIDPLEKLVVDDEEIDRTLLSEVLAPYVRISKKAGQPVFTPEFSRLSEGGKILVYLLARQAATTLGLSSEGSAATPKEVSASTGVKYGTAKPTLVGLVRKGFLSSVGGEYSVPAHALLRIREAIK